MTTIRACFPRIREISSNFRKKAKETYPLPPPVTIQLTCHPSQPTGPCEVPPFTEKN